MIAPQQVVATLRIRGGAPSTSAPRLGAFQVGATIHPEAQVVGEAVAGNATWFQLPEAQFVWGGGCTSALAPVTAQGSMDVVRRPDGSLKALGRIDTENVFGRFNYVEKGGGRIEIDRNWTRSELVTIITPLLSNAGFNRITVHRKAAEPFKRVFASIAAAGLNDLIRTCAGTWVPRHMGWDPTRALSSHSWGTAIDLNVPWNGYGRVPAALGTIGSLREIVGLFEAEGFAWGGHFRPLSICDGMHFELARRDL